MINTSKTIKLENRRMAVIGGLMTVAVIALLPIWAGAQCSGQWDASGKWSFMQGNLADPVEIHIVQNGKAIWGSALLGTPSSSYTFGTLLKGKVSGNIVGDSFRVEIEWDNGNVGVYGGKILPTGRVEGEGFAKNSSTIRHPWRSTGVFKCVPPRQPDPIPRPVTKPTPTPQTKPSQPAPKPPPMKVPGIVLSGFFHPNASSPIRMAVITWDGGPDHPYAEVWVKVNNGRNTFLVEKGKGSVQVPVESTRSYTYTLTDAGKILATVTFVAP